MKNKKIFIGAALVCCLGLFAFLWASKKTPPPKEKPRRPVTVSRSITGDAIQYLDEIGRCVPVERVMVRPQVSGLITEVRFTDGSEVKKGDLLFVLDARPFQAKVDQDTALLTQEQAKASFYSTQLKRNQKLIENQIIATQEMDSAKSSELSSQALLLAAQAAVDRSKIDVSYCSIVSPINGRAGKRLMDVGNIVTANQTDLLEIQCQDPIHVEFTIPENNLCKVRDFIAHGTLSLVASFPDRPDKTRTGKLDFLDSGVKTGSGTVLLRGIFDNSDRMFWPGQFVEVRIILNTLHDSVMVPSDAIQTGVDSAFVFVVNPDDTVSIKNVKVGQKQGDQIVVTEGLSAGETVVVTGQLGLSPGAKIKVVSSNHPQKP